MRVKTVSQGTVTVSCKSATVKYPSKFCVAVFANLVQEITWKLTYSPDLYAVRILKRNTRKVTEEVVVHTFIFSK